MSMLQALLARIEKAREPDRELDGDLAVALNIAPGGMRMSAIDGGLFATGAYTSWRAPNYTASIDDAVALVRRSLPKWSLQIGLSEGFRHPVVVMGRSHPTNATVAREHRTVPLAILSGMLAALEIQEPRP